MRERELAVIRGAPLGWAFPLAFLVHGLMPLGGAIALALTLMRGALRFAVIGAGALVSFALVTLFLRWALRARARVERFREASASPWLPAQLLEVRDLGGAGRVGKRRRATRFRRVWTRILVQQPNVGSVERAGEARYTTKECALLVPGAQLFVALHPTLPEVFLVSKRV